MLDSLSKLQDFLGYGNSEKGEMGLVMSGGGARAAYQAGVLNYLSDAFPDTHFPIMKGVSAGAINTGYLANHTGTLKEAASLMVKAFGTSDRPHSGNYSRNDSLWSKVRP